jgi:hypothetical protein
MKDLIIQIGKKGKVENKDLYLYQYKVLKQDDDLPSVECERNNIWYALTVCDCAGCPSCFFSTNRIEFTINTNFDPQKIMQFSFNEYYADLFVKSSYLILKEYLKTLDINFVIKGNAFNKNITSVF